MTLRTKAILVLLFSLGLLLLNGAGSIWITYYGRSTPLDPTVLLIFRIIASSALAGMIIALLLIRMISGYLKEFEQRARSMIEAVESEELVQMPDSDSKELTSLGESFNRLFARAHGLRQELRRIDSQYNAFLKQSSEAIWRVELDSPMSPNLLEAEQLEFLSNHSRLVECNLIFAELLGDGRPESILGRTLADLFEGAKVQDMDFVRAFVLSNYSLNNADIQLQTSRGSRDFQLSITAMLDEGVLTGCWGTLFDITSRKRTEDVLRDSEHRFRTMADTAPVLIWVSDEHRQDTYFNKSWLDFTGRTLEQELHDGWLEGMHPDDFEHYREVSDTAILARRDFIVEYRLRRHDGRYRWVVDHGTPVVTPENEFSGYIGTTIDVTEQREMVNALKESEERYRNLVDNMSEGLALVDEQEHLLFVNPAAERIFGIEPGKLTGMNLGQFVEPEQFSTIMAQSAMLRAGQSNSYELEISRPGGEKRDIWLTATPRISEGRFAGAFAVFQDVTDRKRAEQERRESEERYKQLVNSMSEGVAIYDDAGRFVYVNHVLSDLWDMNWQDMIGKTPQSIGGDSLGRQVEERRSLASERQPRFEVTLTEPSGRLRSFILSNQPLRNSVGDEVGSFTVLTDTTDIREAEAARIETEERLQRLVENMSEGILIADEQGLCVYANQATEAMLGLEKDTLLGRHTQLLLPEYELERFAREVESIRRGEDSRFEIDVERPSGDTRRVLVSASPMLDISGDFQGAFAVLLDITERTRDEELQTGQRAVLEMVVSGRPLEEVLHHIALMVEDQISDSLCGICLVDASGTQLTIGAAPHLPASLTAGIEGLLVGPRSASCGTAAHIGKPVISSNVFSDPNWTEHAAWFTTECGMRACWSWPILSPGGKVLGTLGLFFTQQREPSERGRARIDILTNIAGLAIHRQRSEEAVRLSEARFRHIYDNAPVMIQSIDQSGSYINVNLKWLEETGYTREEVLGQPAGFVMTKESQARAEVDSTRVWQQGFMRDMPYQFLRKDGTVFDVLVNSVVTDDPGGGMIRLGVVSNVTERRRAEEELNRLATGVQQTAEGIIITNTEGIVKYVNPAIQSITGYTQEEITGNDPELLQLFGDDPSIYDRLKLKHSAERVWKGRFSLKRRDGTDCEAEATISPVRDSDGRIVNFVTVMRDVTKEIALQTKLQHADKAESLAVLAGGIAHDFNNLLMGIIGNASLALTEINPGSMAARRINDIEVAGHRAAELARQMLAYSGKGRFIMEVFDVSGLVQEMVNLMEVSISKNVTLELKLAGDLPKIEADATQIRQVVMNLLTNANEAMGDRRGNITLTTGAMWCDREMLAQSYFDDELEEGIYTFFEVRDTGCGMDETTLKKVFDPFFTTKFTGHGLGMAAVLGIVRGHRGAIIVSSTPGEGTTFRVFLPSSDQPAKMPLPDDLTFDDWRGSGTVLVVDDEETVRSVVEQILAKAGFDVLLAVDGRDGIEKFEQHSDEIVAVLLDMTMPNVNGQEAFKEMKRIREDAVIVMSSGFNERETTYRIMGMGLAGFIQKPYRARDLVYKMREVLERVPEEGQMEAGSQNGDHGAGQSAAQKRSGNGRRD